MKTTVRGVRSVDIDMSQPERAAAFYKSVWNLTEVERRDGSIYFRGTGRFPPHPGDPPCPEGLRDPPPHLRRCQQGHRPRAAQEGDGGRLPERRAARAVGPRRRLRLRLRRSGGPQPRGGLRRGGPQGRRRPARPAAQDRARQPQRRRISRASNDFLVDVLGFRKVDHSGPLHFYPLRHRATTRSIVMGQTATPTLNHVSFEMPDRGIGDARRRPHARRRLSDRMGRRPPRRGQQRVRLFRRAGGISDRIHRRGDADRRQLTNSTGRTTGSGRRAGSTSGA